MITFLKEPPLKFAGIFSRTINIRRGFPFLICSSYNWCISFLSKKNIRNSFVLDQNGNNFKFCGKLLSIFSVAETNVTFIVLSCDWSLYIAYFAVLTEHFLRKSHTTTAVFCRMRKNWSLMRKFIVSFNWCDIKIMYTAYGWYDKVVKYEKYYNTFCQSLFSNRNHFERIPHSSVLSELFSQFQNFLRNFPRNA